MSDAIAFLRRAIEQGQGLAEADIVLKGGRVFDLVSGELVKSDVAICADRIVGTLGEYRGRREIDVSGKVAVPGFIDTHCHVESSLLTPLEFDRCVLRHGVTTSICDPHEIANVLGLEGLRYFLDAAMLTIMDLRVQLSSCVPATALETSGARLEAGDLLALADHPKVLGLAEFMNFPGVLARDPSCLDRWPQPAPDRPCPQRLPRRGHPHRPRGHQSSRGEREARQGYADPHSRGLRVQGSARAQPHHHRA